MIEARCLVCGAPLGELMTHVAAANNGEVLPEVCSEECYEIYYTDEEELTEAKNE